MANSTSHFIIDKLLWTAQRLQKKDSKGPRLSSVTLLLALKPTSPPLYSLISPWEWSQTRAQSLMLNAFNLYCTLTIAWLVWSCVTRWHFTIKFPLPHSTFCCYSSATVRSSVINCYALFVIVQCFHRATLREFGVIPGWLLQYKNVTSGSRTFFCYCFFVFSIWPTFRFTHLVYCTLLQSNCKLPCKKHNG